PGLRGWSRRLHAEQVATFTAKFVVAGRHFAHCREDNRSKIPTRRSEEVVHIAGLQLELASKVVVAGWVLAEVTTFKDLILQDATTGLVVRSETVDCYFENRAGPLPIEESRPIFLRINGSAGEFGLCSLKVNGSDITSALLPARRCVLV